LTPYPLLGSLGAANVPEHVEHRPRRPAMEWTLHRTDCPRHGAHHIGARTRDHARGERRCIHAMVDHGDPVRVERAGSNWVWLLAVDHVKEVRGEREI